jgi:phytoene dehydrogenase-like protein
VETHPRSKVFCSSVISDADSKRTLIKLVDRENFTGPFVERVDANPISITGLCVNLGLESRVDRSGIGPGTIFYQPSYDLRAMVEALSKPTQFPYPGTFAWMLTAHSLVEPSLAPTGCSSLSITVPAVPYGFKRRWGVESGGVRGDRYKEIKEQYAEIVVKSVSQVFPDLIKDVRAYDVCSPITYERYTMALDGCWSDNSQVPKQTLFLRPGPTTALKGLYMAGSKSATGGGVGPTIVSGLLAADCVLKGKFKELF